jgi:hypothetical protein
MRRNPSFMLVIALVIATIGASNSVAWATDWTQFAGNSGDGLYVRTEGTTIQAYGVPPRSPGRGS